MDSNQNNIAQLPDLPFSRFVAGKATVKDAFIQRLFHPRLERMRDELEQIAKAQQVLQGGRSIKFLEYRNKFYDIQTGDIFSSKANEIHHSYPVNNTLIPQFQQLLARVVAIRHDIALIKNFTVALLHKSKTPKDALELLPGHLHQMLNETINEIYREWTYKCRHQDLTLSDTDITLFMRKHQKAYELLRVYRLDDLTQ